MVLGRSYECSRLNRDLLAVGTNSKSLPGRFRKLKLTICPLPGVQDSLVAQDPGEGYMAREGKQGYISNSTLREEGGNSPENVVDKRGRRNVWSPLVAWCHLERDADRPQETVFCD